MRLPKKNIDIHDRERQQVLAARLAIWASIVLFLISAVVGIAVDSITLILDASASLVILAVALMMNFSLKKLHQPPDDLYHFGYGKYEPFTVSLQGGLIIATCVISIKFAIQDIIHPEDIHSYSLPVIATFVSGLLGVFVFRYLKHAAKKTRSSMLQAASFHWYTDTMLSFAVCLGFFIGFLLHRLGYDKITPYVDPVMAITLAIFFIKTPIKTVTHNVLELLDAAPEHSIRTEVKKVIEEYRPRLFGVHRLRIRKAGERIFVEVCFIVKSDMSVAQIEELSREFEKDMKNHFHSCDIVVYFKPK